MTPEGAFGSNGGGYVRMAFVVGEEKIQKIIEVMDRTEMFR